ncbi:hypothetical protein TNCT_544911 [Trichonephila clavata]|uniref:Uncharacterized protein n=1 Tax=Trichonephila clavata TaxID=2740835 RepID=A0A8X6KYX5_TRICU|nr:hypothetical protein TNCT_544911 [Trichonephila clavata]
MKTYSLLEEGKKEVRVKGKRRINFFKMLPSSSYFRDSSCPMPDSRTSSNKDFPDRSLNSVCQEILSAHLSQFFGRHQISRDKQFNSVRGKGRMGVRNLEFQ